MFNLRGIKCSKITFSSLGPFNEFTGNFLCTNVVFVQIGKHSVVYAVARGGGGGGNCRYQFLKYVGNHGFHFGEMLQSYYEGDLQLTN